MKKHRQTAFFALILLLFSSLPALRASETRPEDVITGIRAKILDPNFSPEGFPKDLIEILNVTLTILPKKDYDADFRNRIYWVIGSFSDLHMFSDKIRQYLGLSYMLVAGGASWQIPEELKNNAGDTSGIQTAKNISVRYLDSALAEMKAGRNETAVRELIGFVLLIVTPIRA